MSVAVLIPSLNRPQRLEALVTNIHAVTLAPHKLYFCVSDQESKDILTGLGEWFLDDSESEDRRYVTRMNKLVRLVEEETIFFGSDDVIHHPHWYDRARAMVDRGYHVVVVNDLHNANGTQALIDRKHLSHAVFDSPGDAFHHGYGHNFADNEQFFTAFAMGEFARSMNSFVEHLHPVFGASNAIPWDDTYTDATQKWDEDEKRFIARAELIRKALRP